MHSNSGSDESTNHANSADHPELIPATWWLYLLACADGRTYVGIARDVAARFRLHANGKGAKFTRSNPPLAILGAQSFADKSAALRAEYALKRFDRSARLQWAAQWPYEQ